MGKKNPGKRPARAGSAEEGGRRDAVKPAPEAAAQRSESPGSTRASSARPSSLLDTRVIYCGDCLEQLRRLPDASVDLIYIDPPFNSNRNYEVFWGETKEKRAFEDRHAPIWVGIADTANWLVQKRA